MHSAAPPRAKACKNARAQRKHARSEQPCRLSSDRSRGSKYAAVVRQPWARMASECTFSGPRAWQLRSRRAAAHSKAGWAAVKRNLDCAASVFTLCIVRRVARVSSLSLSLFFRRRSTAERRDASPTGSLSFWMGRRCLCSFRSDAQDRSQATENDSLPAPAARSGRRALSTRSAGVTRARRWVGLARKFQDRRGTAQRSEG